MDATGAGPAHQLERLVFFSDAVFAIAITLLVIELHPPHLPTGSPDSAYWAALAELIPNFVGFIVSFLVIGAFWMGHHRTFAVARHWSPRLLFPNLLLLLTVAAMPFFTGFASANINQRVPIGLYCGWMLLMGLLNLRVQAIATRPPVVDEAASRDAIHEVRQRGLAVTLGAATALVATLVEPHAGQPALISIILWRRLLRRWWRVAG